MFGSLTPARGPPGRGHHTATWRARAPGHDVVPGWATFTGALPRTRDALAAARNTLGTRLFVAGAPPALVGWGGFRAGYEIAEPRRGRGIATAAVALGSGRPSPMTASAR